MEPKLDYSLEFDQQGEILWVTATGTRSLPAVLSIAGEVMAACANRDLNKVLVDVRPLEGLLATSSVFTIPTKHFPKIRDQSVLSQLAIVDRSESKLSNKFFEKLAVKRGLNLRIFSNPDQAIAWLQGE